MEEMEKPEFDIVSVTQTTAKNMYELLLQLAAHIRKLEMENADLRQQVSEQAK
jgi:uncharacterized protein (UPF0335 family)